jgi:hypothetical protein
MLARLKIDSFLCWAVAPALFTVLVIWYQFGFSLGAMLEEWDQLWLIQQNPSVWTSFPGQAWSELFAARPLQALPVLIAHAISTNSFIGLHLVLMVACALRIVGGASIGFFLFRNKAYAAALGVLFWVFPADTQQFEFRTIHISVAVGAMVFAGSLSVRAILATTSARRWSALIASTVVSCVAGMIYEPVLTLYALAPLVLTARYGIHRLSSVLRIRRWIAITWLFGPVINAAYLYYAIVIFKSSYQVSASHGNMLRSIASNLHYLIDSAAYRIFFDAWVSAWLILTDKTAHYNYIVFIGFVIVTFLLLLSSGKHCSLDGKRFVRSIIVGLLACVAGYVPYMVAETHMLITQRTFMALAPGGSIIVIALVSVCCGRFRYLGAVAASIFVLLGVVAQLYQFDRYTRDYVDIVRPYTSILADKTDSTKRVHLVFDSSGFGGHLNGMYISKIQFSATVRRRENDGEFILCMDGPQTLNVLFSNCTFNAGKWRVRNFLGTIAEYSEGEVQVITMGQDIDTHYLSRRASWRDQGTFSESKSIFIVADPHAYRCEADSMWGYSGFCRGEGWSDGVFNHDGFRHINYFVSVAQNASFIFSLSPSAEFYVLKAEIFGRMSSDLLSHMRITINGTAVDVKMIGNALMAQVPAASLREGQNKINFLNVLPAGSATGLALVRVDLAPKGSHYLDDAENNVSTLVLNQWQDLGAGDTHPMLQYGFSETEPTGTWTDGKSAQMIFKLPAGTTTARFIGEAIPFFDETHTQLDVAIDVNGTHISDKTFRAPAKIETFEIPIEIGSEAAKHPIVVTMSFKGTARPSSQDQRDLGLFFRRFKVVK